MNNIFPIKCKAWHENLNKMFSAEELGQDQVTISPDGKGFINVSGVNTRLSQYYPFMIPLRFIGLIDICSAEIYEADIVSFTKTHNNESYIGEVQYHIDVAGFMLETVNNDPWYSFEFGLGTVNLKVLGNRYEDPELMGDHT